MLFGWFRVMVVSIVLGLVYGGGAWAEVSDGRTSKEGGVRALEERAEDRRDDLKDGMAKINAIGAQVDESRTSVGEMRGRTREIEGRARELELQSKAQTEDLEEARGCYEDQVRAAYKGDDLSGVLSMVGGIVDGEESITASVQTSEVLAQGRDDIEQFEDARQSLQNSIRQLEQKKEDYGVLVKEERRKSEELRLRERDLDAAIDRISESRTNIRQRIEARLRELEAAEKVGKLQKPVSGRRRQSRPGAGTGDLLALRRVERRHCFGARAGDLVREVQGALQTSCGGVWVRRGLVRTNGGRPGRVRPRRKPRSFDCRGAGADAVPTLDLEYFRGRWQRRRQKEHHGPGGRHPGGGWIPSDWWRSR